MEKHPPKPLTAETLQAANEALLKAEPWRKLPEPWQGVFRSYQEMRLAKQRIYIAIFDPEFSRDLQAAGGRDSEAGKAVFQRADQEWKRLTGLPILCNGRTWYDAAVHAGYRPPEADKITLDDAERAVRAWAVGLLAERRRVEGHPKADQGGTGGQPPAKGKRKASINARMIDTLQKRPEAKDWTIEQWMQHLGCKSKASVAKTKCWETIMGARAVRKVQRLQRDGMRSERGSPKSERTQEV